MPSMYYLYGLFNDTSFPVTEIRLDESLRRKKVNTKTVSFSDDEFVIGPCRSTATHDNDRK
jgi:hypothetical protein